MSVNLRVCMLRIIYINYATVFGSPHHKDRVQRTYFGFFFYAVTRTVHD